MRHFLLRASKSSADKAGHCGPSSPSPPALFLQFIRRRIHENHVIPALTQLAQKHATEILGIARYTDEGDASQVKEIGNVSNCGGHGIGPPSERNGIDEDLRPSGPMAAVIAVTDESANLCLTCGR